jgi:uncharacterized membrane protein
LTTYEWLLWLHVTFAALWAGGSIMLTILGARISGTNTDERAYFISLVEWLGLRFFLPVSVLTLVFGVWLAVEGDWDFGASWISLSFVLFFASFVTGAAYIGPTSSKIVRRAEAEGADDAQAQSMTDRLMWVARVDSFVLLVIIYLMTIKPGE